MDLGIIDQIAIVTGGGQGIGEAIAYALAREGVDVVVADLNTETAAGVSKKIESMGRKSLARKVDVSKEKEVKEMIDATIDHFHRVDILINNAGISPRRPDGMRTLIAEMPEEEFNRVIDVNLKGVFNCSKYVLPHMIRRRYGNIVNISSCSAKLTDLKKIPSGAHYNASKAAVSNFTMSLANEVAQHGIRVNAISPGRIKTALMKTSTNELEGRLLENIPLSRFGLPEDIANAALFLVSRLSSYITGEILDVDGGLCMD